MSENEVALKAQLLLTGVNVGQGVLNSCVIIASATGTATEEPDGTVKMNGTPDVMMMTYPSDPIKPYDGVAVVSLFLGEESYRKDLVKEIESAVTSEIKDQRFNDAKTAANAMFSYGLAKGAREWCKEHEDFTIMSDARSYVKEQEKIYGKEMKPGKVGTAYVQGKVSVDYDDEWGGSLPWAKEVWNISENVGDTVILRTE